MKRLIALICAVLIACVSLCSCSGIDNTMKDMKDKASEAVSGVKSDPARRSGDNKGLTDDNRESLAPTDSPVPTEEVSTGTDYTEGDSIGENLGDMIENGRVEDGDGNVGDLENSDGDSNIDKEAAEYAQERVSAENNETEVNDVD